MVENCFSRAAFADKNLILSVGVLSLRSEDKTCRKPEGKRQITIHVRLILPNEQAICGKICAYPEQENRKTAIHQLCILKREGLSGTM